MTNITVSKKYEFTDESFTFDGITLHRIRALRDFANVKAGTLGGFIEKESNLSHDGNCWVGHEARVYNNAHVCDNATVSNYARVFDHAKIEGNAQICDNTRVNDHAVICDDAKIEGNVKISGAAHICSNSLVCDGAVLCVLLPYMVILNL